MSAPVGTIAVPVSPGELLDKITILEIKAARITDAAKLQSVRYELDLLRAVREEHIALPADLAACVAELRTVNENLWAIEDQIRDCERRKDFGVVFVELARSIYRLNDRRAGLKRRINEQTLSPLHEEKSHTAY